MGETTKPITGRTVLFWLIGFFLVVFLVNGVMTWLALNSWNGLSTDNAYRKGLAYNEEIEQARKQALSGWKLHISSTPETQKGGNLEIGLIHPEASLTPPTILVQFRRPVVEGYDFELALPLTEQEEGKILYAAPVDLPLPGVWEITAIAKSNNDTKYKLSDRIVVSK